MRPKRSRKGPFSGNLERRFRRFRETRCPERARLLDTTVGYHGKPSSLPQRTLSVFFGGAYSLPSAAAENGAPAKGVPGAPKRDRAPRPRLRSVGSERPPFPTSWQRPRANSSGWWRARRLAAVARETEGPGATASEPVVARVAKRDRAFKGGSFARRRSRRKGASQAGEEGGAERSAAAAGSR